jgi:cytochrome c oxidase assembly protein subunit 15
MEQAAKRKAVAKWLLTGVFMIMVLILIGGITRLTGSGLSITDWEPVKGMIPPLTDEAWDKAFNSYKQIGQYQYLNSDFTLSDFKSIFFWEWFHRFWARMIGIVFLVGFVYFVIKKYFDKDMIIPFVILFLLGGLQGTIGWIMVASGLNPDDLYVGHIELAAHFTMALILLTYTLWFALKMLIPQEQRYTNNKLHYFTLVIIGVLFIQLPYGAFMAGLKAAMNAPTWPDINGSYIPDNLANKSWISDPINIHFFHRQLGYLLATLIFFWFGNAVYKTKHTTALFRRTHRWPFVLVILQIVLGITTVLTVTGSIPDTFGEFQMVALLHQAVAMLLLMALVVNLYVVRRSAVN